MIGDARPSERSVNESATKQLRPQRSDDWFYNKMRESSVKSNDTTTRA